MSPERRVIKVQCQCGEELARYEKEGKGRLIKMYVDHIVKGPLVPTEETKYENEEDVLCPKCEERIGTVKMVHGRPAIKINQGQIKKTGT